MLDNVATYVKKYGDVQTWPLALKFQVLFEVITELVDKKGSVSSKTVEDVYSLVFSLGQIENSGVVCEGNNMNDNYWDEHNFYSYRCGRMVLDFENEVSFHHKYSSIWWLKVKKVDENATNPLQSKTN